MGRLTADLKAKVGDKGYPAGFDFKTFKGSDLAGTIARHPIYNHLRHSRESGNDKDWERALEFYARPRPFLAGDFVTTDSGTGLVHMSPDHGEDDFDLCKANGIDPVFAVAGDGKYRADWAWLAGQGSVIHPQTTGRAHA